MVNPMMAAIKKRKSGGDTNMGDHAGDHSAQHADVGAQHEVDPKLQMLVASLKPHEHEQLRQMLDQKPNTSQAIAKGAASTEEQGKIAEQSAKENQENALHDMDSSQSDDIGKSMLDSRNMHGPAPEKPRGLGDRVKQSIASKLKSKGKI